MGDTIWVDVQGRAKDDLPHDNSIMLRLKNELDRLSDKLGVPKLSDFYDYSELAAQFAEETDDGVEVDDKAFPKKRGLTPSTLSRRCGRSTIILGRNPRILASTLSLPSDTGPQI